MVNNVLQYSSWRKTSSVTSYVMHCIISSPFPPWHHYYTSWRKESWMEKQAVIYPQQIHRAPCSLNPSTIICTIFASINQQGDCDGLYTLIYYFSSYLTKSSIWKQGSRHQQHTFWEKKCQYMHRGSAVVYDVLDLADGSWPFISLDHPATNVQSYWGKKWF